MMNIKHILSRGYRAGRVTNVCGMTGFAMRFIISLLLLVATGVNSVWAQSFPVAGKVYTIKARFTNGSGDLYLTNSSSTLTFPTIAANEASQWIAEATGNTTYPWRFRSVVEPTKYLNANESSGIGNGATNFAVNECSTEAGTYHLWGNISGKGDRNIATWASNDSRTGFGQSGNGGCFGGGHNNSNWSTDYEITAVTLNNVKIKFVNANGTALTQGEVNYTPEGGSSTQITTSNTTYNFGGAYFSVSAFSSTDFTKTLSVSYNAGENTLTFTITQNKWYYIICRNGNTYVSSDYVNVNGDMMLNNANKPTDYKGLWMEIPTTALDANGQGTVYFVNAYYGDTKILAITGSGSGASAKMYSQTDVPAGAVTLFDRKYRADRDNAFFFKSEGSANNYLNRNQNKVAFWDSSNAYNNPDNGSTFDHVAVPNLPDNATIQFIAASSAVTLPGDLNILYRNLEFYRKSGSTIVSFPSAPGIFSELQNGQNYSFHNVPGLTSLFTVYNHPELRVARVEVDGSTVKLFVDRLPGIIHRPHATFNYLATMDADHKPNSKFIQEGKGLIDHPNKDNFIGAGYTDNDRKIQNTSVFHLTQYTKKGETTQVRMPYRRERDGSAGKINKYQRWYDYTTERRFDEGILQGLSGYTMYYNGIAKTGVTALVNIKLPSDKDEIFVGVDDSEFNDYSTDSEGNFIEPSLSMRTIIHVVSAEKMADALVVKDGEDKWWEEKTYIVPNIKRGSATHKNNSDLLPLDMPFSNYWIYDESHNLMRIVPENNNYNTLANNITIEIEGSASEYITADIFKNKGESGIDDPAGVSSNHFLYYNIKGDGLTRVVPAGSQAIIKVYAHNGTSGVKYQLAKFTLNFQADCEPLAITSVVGNPASTRSRDYFKNLQMAEVASLTFSEKRVDFKGFGGVGNNSNHYAFPLDPTRTSYAFSPDDAFGGYRITKSAYGMKVLPVSLYERNIKEGSTSLTPIDDDYYLYIDAAETPGQVASIPLEGSLCPGTRLFFYGWLNSQNPFEAGITPGTSNATPASVILELVGRKDGKEVILATYLPGVLSDAAYTPEGTVIRSVKDGKTASTEAAYSSSYNRDGHGDDQTRIAAWQSIGFSYLLTESGFDGFELRVINNCFSTAGGDYSLDDFRVFVNPPKGNVDFTTPLCSDKVRHAKIHSDYDMLKNISNVNESDPNSKLSVSYCFLEASVFDNYSEGGLTINDIFEIDEQTGNHNLKYEYQSNDAAKTLINNAFGRALVGTRKLSADDPENNGFHTFDVNLNYELIPEYAYNDSKSDVIYRELGVDGIRRIVFKEDVVRGEMIQIEYDGQLHYPHMRPSTTYYLVFSPIPVDSDDITAHTVGTQIFHIHESCSFFGKFTTKDPMHVILDNADIESDLPVKAVCHGESVSFEFDMPVLKANKPIIDEAYCISDEGLNGQIVPSTNGAKHYRYEASFKDNDVMGVVKNMPYDWWLGGTLDGTTYRGTIEAYQAATHPSIKYDKPKDKAHKEHGDPVNIAQAMTDFRFFYPDEDGSTWSSVVPREYNHDTGYGLLQSEINTIKAFVDAGIIVLHKNQYTMSLTAGKSENLTPNELSVMTSNELNSQILSLALTLDDDPTIAALKPLKDLEGTVLEMISADGRKELTFQEFAYESYEQVKVIAGELSIDSSLPESELRKAVETALRAKSPEDLRTFAMANFSDIGHERRAHLVIRALNIMNDETLAGMTESQKRDEAYVREVLRVKMIDIFSKQDAVVLKKMLTDTSTKLTAEEYDWLQGNNNLETQDQAHLAHLLEQALAMITNNIIADLNSDKYIHFTLVPIMPSQENFVDEPYIFCPEPRGVKVRITSGKPKMLDGFADMPYPSDMTNVPMRIGLAQINDVPTAGSKTLRVPLRKLEKAVVKEGHHLALAKADAPLYLVKTDDPALKSGTSHGVGLMEDSYIQVGKIQALKAVFDGNDNYMDITFNAKDVLFPGFREGYTYRLSYEFIEQKQNNEPTLSCSEWIYFDMKVVPEYQKWTGSVNSDWTNDKNWARADRGELNADNAATGDVIAGSTDITVEANYPTNAVNQTTNSFVPMYFTNVLVGDATTAPVLYTNKETEESYAYTPASRSAKTFLRGLHSTATRNIVYDMEVAPSAGAWNADKNYECTLFGTYIANGITFQPGAQMGNTHYLIYNKAWVEYELDADRWYTLGSPLMRSVAGDWYSPTKGGKQLTPHFYDINYSESLNDRFRPAYYQRSWDRDGNNKVYEKSGGTYDSYVKADWSYVYNDATVDYSKGGFSVKAELGYMEGADRPGDSKVLVRLPKADTSYKYYDVEGQTGQATDAAIGARSSSYRLLSDELKADGSGSISMKVSNTTADNNFLLLHNPFMAAMDMEEFFAKNTDLEPKYWIVDANKQMVSVKTADGWIATSEAGGRYVAPLQGFFVKKKDILDAPNSISAAYNATMQTVMAPSPTQNNPNIRTRAISTGADMIRLIAERDGASSTAVIMLGDGFSDGYVAGEDCETFVDGNLYDKPTVYTSAGSMAQTINVRKSLEMVPVGMISSDDSEVVLRFDLSESSYRTLYLYDGESNSFSEINDGAEVVMSGNNAGRYYLASTMSFEQLDAVDGGSQKGVWTLSGNYCGDSVDGLQPGLYIVDGVKMLIRK